MYKIVCTVAAAALLISSTAQAGMLGEISGGVRVNQGSGYQLVNKPLPLNPGNLVMVSPGGLAQVSYSCGMTDVVKPGAVYTVGDDVRKCAQANVANGPRPSYLGFGTGGGGGDSLWLWAVGIGAVVGATCLISWCNDDSSSP